jgi:hypothetical protein
LTPQKSAFPLDLHQILVFELFKMMGQRGSGNAWFRDDVAHYDAVRMRRKQQAHDALARFRAERREHNREARHLFICLFFAGRHPFS